VSSHSPCPCCCVVPLCYFLHPGPTSSFHGSFLPRTP
jgi:hypothetical protein